MNDKEVRTLLMAVEEVSVTRLSSVILKKRFFEADVVLNVEKCKFLQS